MKDIVEIIEFSDPVCTWCYGSEPILTTLKYRFGNQIKINFVMGGLVRDIREWYDAHDVELDPIEVNNRKIPASWLEATKSHGMPVLTSGFKLFSEEYPSTYPQNIAYKAAQFESEELAQKLLRRLRFATILEGKLTSRPDVLMELASEVGLNVVKFVQHYQDGSAETAFSEDRYLVQQYQVRGYPAFLVKYQDKQVLMRSFQTYDDFVAVFKMLGASLAENIPEASPDNLEKFIADFGPLAPIEIKMAFNLNGDTLEQLLTPLSNEGKIKRTQIGTGEIIAISENSRYCNPITGVCYF